MVRELRLISPACSLVAFYRIDVILGGRFPPYTVSLRCPISLGSPGAHGHLQAKKQASLKQALGIKLPPRPRFSEKGHVSSHNLWHL